ncbi:MAG: serine/threonine protein kinase [Deltaproteobacteria bacterium]|nr:serine/threonine protein kinase [Deltaproteobacteria bacterium]MBK8719069.1 serine/threonine protein kinase [Deltaproteobacteria bacterium]MBP7287984.1 serine/threonine protein kinase [Nannocystaceae bacterium]
MLERVLAEAATRETTAGATPAVVCDALEGALMRSRIRGTLFGDPVQPPTFGHYVVERPLGRGGMATVFVARDVRLRRRVALKLLTFDGAEDPHRRQRILDEARAAAAVAHDHIVRIFEVGHAIGSAGARRAFIAMELLDGCNLRTWVATRAPRTAEVVAAYAQAARGLAAAHRAGIVHGDFKADNAMIDGRGHVRVLDFGLARVMGRDTLPMLDVEGDTTPAETTPRGIAGTPAYMAPELFFGAPPDARSDQWALCASLYEALVGQLPFHAPSAWGQPPHSPDTLPRSVAAALARGLDTDPRRRHDDLDALARALTRPQGRHPWRIAGVGVLATALLVATRGDDPCARIGVDDLPWGPEDAAAIRTAMTAVSSELAADADAVLERLDRHATAWVDGARQRCEATPIDADLGQERCARSQRRRFAATVAALRDAGAREAAAARAWVLQWPDIGNCDDLDETVTRSPDDATAVDAIEAELDIARVELELGRTGVEPLMRLRDRAAAIGDGPLLATVEAELGRAATVVDDGSGAALLEHAHALAITHGLDALATRTALDLALFHATQTLELEQAERWLREADSRDHDDHRDHADPRFGIGFAIAFGRNDLSRAQGFAAAALADAERRCPDGCADTVAALLDLARIDWQRDEIDAALALTRRADGIARAGLGRWHPASGDVAYLMGRLLLEHGDVERGVAVLEDLLHVRSMTAASTSPTIVATRFALAQAWRAAGDPARAAAALDRVIDDARHIDLWSYEVLALGERASVAAAVGDLQGAARMAQIALEVAEAGYGSDHPDVAMLQKNLAVHLGRVGRHDAALLAAQRGWATWKRASPTASRQDVAYLQVLGSAFVGVDRIDDGIDTLRAGLEAGSRAPIGRSGVRAHRELADALRRRGRDDDAAMTLELGRARCRELPASQQVAATCDVLTDGEIDGPGVILRGRAP